MRTLFLNPVSGVAGDMLVGALLHLGADTPEFWRQLRSLPLPKGEWSADVAPVTKQGITARQFSVTFRQAAPKGSKLMAAEHAVAAVPARHLPEILALIAASDAARAAKTRAARAFQLLAEAESAVHGVPPEQVHFHEVGAVDAIVDILGACIAVSLLDVQRVVCSAVALGGGTVRCAHGRMPVPVPAVVNLLHGVPTVLGTADSELTTPTGAALLRALVEEFGGVQRGSVLASGYGAGTKDFPTHANVLQAVLLESPDAPTAAPTIGNDPITILECTLDDFPGERLSYVLPQLLAAGALDATVTPCLMKKGRQGMVIQVLAHAPQVAALTDLLLRETSSFGVRGYPAWRQILDRRFEALPILGGEVTIKLGCDPTTGAILHLAPEYETCAALARATGRPLNEVYELATAAAVAKWRKGS